MKFRLELAKDLAWLFMKLRIITERDYVNLCFTLLAVDRGLRIKEVPID